MRRQKRDISQRAYNRGYQQGYQGRSDENCPFQTDSGRAHEWTKGWREGRDDLQNGIKI
ncbi:MAG TPA: ribosome modulation factor, partial [Porticoccaceae bacterium]|nr:ribosome modulation factor [Porticoccaceae bacterium]